jgi:competence protein ComEA
MPGVYQLPPGSRVQDALDSAGGLAADADPRSISLARVLSDGEKLYVPAAGEFPPEGEVASRSASIAIDQPAAPGGAQSRIDINTATLEELDTLPGIGPKTAQAILDYRQTNGMFKSVEDLLNVKGIGDATLAKLRDLVIVQGAP